MSETAKLAEIVTWTGVNEMCRVLQVSLNRGYALLWSGRISAQKIGGQWRISPAAIQQYDKQRKARRHGRD
jgi:excisionase family DNA binding protein